MKKTSFFLWACAGLLVTSGCYRNDIRTVEYQVPGMAGPECLDYLTGKLRAVEGFINVDADFSTRVVSVTFDGLRLAAKNIEFTLAGAGFDVNETPGAPEAQAGMPSSCR